MLNHWKVNRTDLPDSWLSVLSNFVTSNHSVGEKLEKQSLQPFWHRPRILLVRHSFSSSEMLGLLGHGIVVNVEHHLLPSSRATGVRLWANSALNCTLVRKLYSDQKEKI
jgi:hypothetical protein